MSQTKRLAWLPTVISLLGSIVASAVIYFTQNPAIAIKAIGTAFKGASSVKALFDKKRYTFEIEEVLRLTMAIDMENRVIENIKDNVHYLDHYSNLLTGLYSTQQIEPKASMFVNKERYKKTQNRLLNEFNIRPTPHIRNLKVKLEVSSNAYEAFLTIPFNLEDTKVDLFLVIP